MQIDEKVLRMPESEFQHWVDMNDRELTELDLQWVELWEQWLDKAIEEKRIHYGERVYPGLRRAHRSQWRFDELREFDPYCGLINWEDKQ